MPALEYDVIMSRKARWLMFKYAVETQDGTQVRKPGQRHVKAQDFPNARVAATKLTENAVPVSIPGNSEFR